MIELCKIKGYDPCDILFVGNSVNDEWVYQSGAKTLCVNPDSAKIENLQIVVDFITFIFK